MYFSLKTKVGKASMCIPEVVWMIWPRNAQGKLEFGCKNQKLAGFVLVLQFQVLGKFQQGFRAFSILLQFANEVEFIGKGFRSFGKS